MSYAHLGIQVFKVCGDAWCPQRFSFLCNGDASKDLLVSFMLSSQVPVKNALRLSGYFYWRKHI